MNARKFTHVIITMSPKELRDIADRMEGRFPAMCIGDSTFISCLHITEDLKVDMHLDQEYFNKKEV